jgi:4-aminobutyrate aminotransferase-like enzyme
VTEALRAQMDKLPQLACQYLHREKIELAEMICESVERGFGMKGRVHFNVGGAQAVEDALAADVEATGVTIHLVDEGLDTGPILRQEQLPLEPRETLEERIHAVEHRLLPTVVREMIV